MMGTLNELKWLAVDFDNTLQTPNESYEIGEPIHANIAKLRECVDLGYKIIIHTARHWEEYHLIESWLDKWNIPYKSIVCGKVLAHRYIDDKAIPADADWKEYL